MRTTPHKEKGARQAAGGAPARSDGPQPGSLSAGCFFRQAAIVLAGLLLPALLSSPLAAREDSASLVFRKTAGPQKTSVYVVKKGEWIAAIFRARFGDEPVPYALIRKINPGIRNLNRIYPGQKIILPVRETDIAETANAAPKAEETPVAEYLIQEGDSISRIILAELNVDPEKVLSTYRLIRRLNPDIEDMNTLSAGGRLKLPANLGRTDRPAPATPQTGPDESEKPLLATEAKTPQIPEGLLGMIRPVIGRMKGTLTATGSYFIPLRDNTQVTIDCALIPIVELADGSTVLLDFGNRLPDHLKGLIGQSWANYAFVPAEELGDDLAALQGIIRHSRNYLMYHAERPLALTQKPEILATPDWIIEEKKASGGTLYRQGLFLLGGDEQPLPAEARTFLEKYGLIVTEISAGQAIVPLTVQSAPPTISDLRGLRGVAFAEQLLKALGESPVANAEVVILDQARHGFNLSISADLLLRRGEKRFIIHTKKLPEQFIRILKEEGAEIVPIGERDPGRPLAESVLPALQIPVSYGHFSFRIPENGRRPRLTATFPALRARAGDDALYLIDFDISSDILSLLYGRLGGRLAKY